MASYLEQYQYDQVQPANTNVEQIAKSFQTKMAYWQQGASQVKNAYQNYLGLSLTNGTNKQQLEEYMKSAKEEILKASNADLSIGENVANTMGVFDNLTNGKSAYSQNILGDHQLTSFYQNQEEAVKNAKTKDKGLGYSNVNEQYMRQGYNEFANDADPSNWKKHAQNKKSYEQYYDYNNEYRKILDDCTANKISNTSEVANTLYFKESSDNSLTQSKLNGCLESGLSSKARRQLQIEGSVAFGKDYATLGNAYSGLLNDHAKALTSQQQEDQAMLTYYNNIKTKTPTDEEAIKYYSERISSYKPQFEDLNNSVANLAKGDYRFVENNYETLAGQVYSKVSQNKFASSFSNINQSEKYSPNQAAMLQYRENAENNRLDYRTTADIEAATTLFGRQKEIEQIKAFNQLNLAQIKGSLKAGLKPKFVNGQLVLSAPDAVIEETTFSEKDATTFGKSQFDKQLASNTERLLNSEIDFSSKLLSDSQIQNDLTSGDSIKIPDWKDQRGVSHKGLELPTRNADEKQAALDYLSRNPAIFTATTFYQTLYKKSLSEDPNKFKGSYGDIISQFTKEHLDAKDALEQDRVIDALAKEELQRKGWNPQQIQQKKIEFATPYKEDQTIYMVPVEKDARRFSSKPGEEYKTTMPKEELLNMIPLKSISGNTPDNHWQVNYKGKLYNVYGGSMDNMRGTKRPGSINDYLANTYNLGRDYLKDEQQVYNEVNYQKNNQVNITNEVLSQNTGFFSSLRQTLGQDTKGKSKRFNIVHASTTNQGDANIEVDVLDPKIKIGEGSVQESLQKELNLIGKNILIEPTNIENRFRIKVTEGLRDDVVNVQDITGPLTRRNKYFETLSKTRTATSAPDYTPVGSSNYVGTNGITFTITMMKKPNGFSYKVGKVVNGKNIYSPQEYGSPETATAVVKSLAQDPNDDIGSRYDVSNYTTPLTQDNNSSEEE